MGIAEALILEEGGDDDGDMPAGDAIDVGNMKSSMFMASGSGVFERSTDSRSFAIPDGALVGCWLALRTRFVSPRTGAPSGLKRTVPVLVLCASGSWPSFSRSNSPSVPDLAIVTWSCYRASISAFRVGPSFAFHRGRPGRCWRRRPSNLERSSRGGGPSESACFLERCPVCLEGEGRERAQEYVGCAMIVFALVWVAEMTAGSRGWRMMRGYSWGSL